MKTVDDYERIRKAYYLEGLSIREISRRFHFQLEWTKRDSGCMDAGLKIHPPTEGKKEMLRREAIF